MCERAGPAGQCAVQVVFAAKEAALPGPCVERNPASTGVIEVVRRADGSCDIAWHGAAACAAALGADPRAPVSSSHDGDYAAAVVARCLNKQRGGGVPKMRPHDTLEHAENRDQRALRDTMGGSRDLTGARRPPHQLNRHDRHASVNVMLGARGAFDVDSHHMLNRSVFRDYPLDQNALGQLGRGLRYVGVSGAGCMSMNGARPCRQGGGFPAASAHRPG